MSYTLSLFPAINKLGRSPATSVIYAAWFVAAKFTAVAAGILHSICSEARYWLRIAISAYPTCIGHPVRGFPSEYCYTVWYRKTRMAWLPDGEKILKIRFTIVMDTQTDTQTPHDGIGRTYA